MLTQDDLKAIKKVVNEEVGNGLSIGLKSIQKDIRSLKKDVRILRKDLNITITSFDREIIDTRRRINRIEDHLNLPPLTTN